MNFGYDPGSDSDYDTERLVRILDRWTFFTTIRDNDFVVVKFGTSMRCCGGPVKNHARFEKAASMLHKENSPIVFATIDALEDKYIAEKYCITSFSSIKIFRHNQVDDYKGPLDAQEMIKCLKRLFVTFPAQITSAEDTVKLIQNNKNKIVVFGIFPEFSGIEHDNFIKVAQILKWDYDFGHTLDVSHLAHGNYSSLLVGGPVVRVFKPFKYDDGFVDTRDFDVDALVNFVQESSRPAVTFYNHDPLLDVAFFSSNVEYDKAMLFIDCQHDVDYEKTYCAIAKNNKGDHKNDIKGISFMVVDSVASQDNLWLFELHKSEVPLFVIKKPSGETFVKTDMKSPGDILKWLEDYKVDKVKEYGTISGEKDGLVWLVDADTFEKKFMDSDQNVFLLLGPLCHWCGTCKESVKVLNDVALRLGKEKIDDVIIAKLYKNAHDIRVKYLCQYALGVDDYPTLCFKRAGQNKLYLYHGLLNEYNIIQFIKKNWGRRKAAQIQFPKKLHVLSESVPSSQGVEYIGCFQQMVMDSPSNVLLVLCGWAWEMDDQLRKLLDSVADDLRKEKENNLVICYMSANLSYDSDVFFPKALVEVMHCFTTLDDDDGPTIYLKSARGNLFAYDCDGVISKENIINFITKHKLEQDDNLPRINYDFKRGVKGRRLYPG
ncbi:hypothetical protein ACFE04_030888 [Oxalis oulophora]